MKTTATNRSKWIVVAVVLIGICLAIALSQGLLNRQGNASQVQKIVNSEELLLDLTKKLKHLSRSAANLQLPDPLASKIFADSVQVDGDLEFSAAEFTWKSNDESSVHAASELSLWSSLFENCDYLENVKFYNIDGGFSDPELTKFKTKVGFEALATISQGDLASLRAELEVGWTSKTGSTSIDWLIDSWKLSKFTVERSKQLYFKDVLADCVATKSAVASATRSKHHRLTSHLLNGGDYFLQPGVKYPFFFPDVTLEHPGVSIVDIDQDGWEDIFVAMQYDSNLLFHNQGDGTFVEAAAKFGLAIKGDCTCALFADFDNDGDPDVFIGRGRRESIYLTNRNGQFVESNQLIDRPLPAMVSSISAADYNSDGQLDVYFSTYSPIEAEYENNRTPQWVELFLTEDQSQEYKRLQKDAHAFLSRTGPPNLLLQNSGGGKFATSSSNTTLELWKMTFQASWHDFDDDGDPDLYVANDYHSDNFFRNDGEAGFVDITDETGLNQMGFGMGVSFGDYDHDGQTDIYVSNMFSKAGQRILSQVEEIDTRFKEMAKGNFLFRKTAGRYELVSGLQRPAMQVSKAGWSWGGQFADFDNDGYRDIYVVNGYYTAPDDIAVEVDL